MKREILCLDCHRLAPMHPEDVLNGFTRRFTPLKVSLSLVCDHCASPINQGEPAMAITWWNINREEPPWFWEVEYGKTV